MKKLILILISIFVTLCCLEVFLAFYPPKLALQREQLWDHLNSQQSDGVAEFVSSYEYDKDIGYVRKSAVEQAATLQQAEGKAILVLGDSVSELGQYPTSLEEMLNASNSASPVTVVNTGTIGYSTKMEKDFFEKFVKDNKPDLVILQMHPNDIGGTPVILPTQDSWIAFSPTSQLTSVQLPILKESRLYRLLVVLYLERMSQQNDSQAFQREMKSSLLALHQELEQQQIPLVIFIEPAYYPFDPGDYTYQNVKQIVVESGLADNLVEMEEVFNAAGHEQLMGNYDHPNILGHQLIAATLYPRVKLLLGL